MPIWKVSNTGTWIRTANSLCCLCRDIGFCHYLNGRVLVYISRAESFTDTSVIFWYGRLDFHHADYIRDYLVVQPSSIFHRLGNLWKDLDNFHISYELFKYIGWSRLHTNLHNICNINIHSCNMIHTCILKIKQRYHFLSEINTCPNIRICSLYPEHIHDMWYFHLHWGGKR